MLTLGKAHGFRSRMGCGPVAFPVFLWWCLRHLSPLCFCAYSRHPEFPVPACESQISCWVRCPLLMATRVAATLCHGQLSISSWMCPVGHLLPRCPTSQVAELGHTDTPPHSAAPRCSTLAGPGALGSVQPLAPVQHLHLVCSPCPGVGWALPVSVQFVRTKAMADIETSSWETAWSLSTVPLAEIKHCSPRYLFSKLLFQSRRENYRPLITQGEELTTPIFVISSTTIKHFGKRAWKPEIVGQGSFCLVPSLIAHRRNKNEGSSLLLSLASKNVCPIWDQELGLLGVKMLSLGKVLLLFPAWQFRAFIDFKAGWSGCISWVWPDEYHERVSPVIPTLGVVLVESPVSSLHSHFRSFLLW